MKFDGTFSITEDVEDNFLVAALKLSSRSINRHDKIQGL